MRRLAACPQTARWIVGMVMAGLVLAAGAILCTALFLGARAHDAASIHALFRAQAVSSAGMLQQRLRTLVSGGCGMVVLAWVMQAHAALVFLFLFAHPKLGRLAVPPSDSRRLHWHAPQDPLQRSSHAHLWLLLLLCGLSSSKEGARCHLG